MRRLAIRAHLPLEHHRRAEREPTGQLGMQSHPKPDSFERALLLLPLRELNRSATAVARLVEQLGGFALVGAEAHEVMTREILTLGDRLAEVVR
jgi:hypothetical protein